MNDKDLVFESGLVRMVFDFEALDQLNYFKVPSIELSYKENMGESHWQCDFNDNTILDKTDHHGSSTIILLNRDKISELEQRHENTLVLHGEFPKPAHVLAESSYINFFQ